MFVVKPSTEESGNPDHTTLLAPQHWEYHCSCRKTTPPRITQSCFLFSLRTWLPEWSPILHHWHYVILHDNPIPLRDQAHMCIVMFNRDLVAVHGTITNSRCLYIFPFPYFFILPPSNTQESFEILHSTPFPFLSATDITNDGDTFSEGLTAKFFCSYSSLRVPT